MYSVQGRRCVASAALALYRAAAMRISPGLQAGDGSPIHPLAGMHHPNPSPEGRGEHERTGMGLPLARQLLHGGDDVAGARSLPPPPPLPPARPPPPACPPPCH